MRGEGGIELESLVAVVRIVLILNIMHNNVFIKLPCSIRFIKIINAFQFKYLNNFGILLGIRIQLLRCIRI